MASKRLTKKNEKKAMEKTIAKQGTSNEKQVEGIAEVFHNVRKMYRIMKNEKVFGLFIKYFGFDKRILHDRGFTRYYRMDNRHLIETEDINFICNGANTQLNDRLNFMHELLRHCKVKTNDKEKITKVKRRIFTKVCENYFKEHKKDYKFTINKLKLQAILGTIFSLIGLFLVLDTIRIIWGYELCALYSASVVYFCAETKFKILTH